MARKRFNRVAICSSDDYKKSRRIHQIFLEERHSHFNEMVVNGDISIDVPVIKKNRVSNRFKTIRVFGRNMKVSIDEYNTHCKSLEV